MDINPMFQPLVAVLWYLIPVLIIAGIVKTPWFTGKFGEFLVNLSARCLLDKSRYHSSHTMDRHNYSHAGKQ
ncbi:hypothetical protein [Marinobacter gelidimuriae]|uniref:hypothetical protein n=1 Tax=Marinobacter gelidimuriae TaxID=2739064 RepID=UPI00037F9690|nr:hypothetical protein [Marinobacter gelidimuriae]